MNMKFFYLHFCDEDTGGVAYSSRPDISEVAQLAELPKGTMCFSLAQGLLQDYQANDLGWPLMSPSMRRHFAGANVGAGLAWLNVFISSRGLIADYFIPSFGVEPDVLDMDRSIFVNGPIGAILMKACLAAEKVRELDFFPLPGSDFRLVVSDRIKRAIENDKLTGIDFSSVPVF